MDRPSDRAASTDSISSPLSRPVLVYDGECDLCRAARDFALRRTRPGALHTLPFQHPDLEQLAPGVQREHARNEALFLDEEERRQVYEEASKIAHEEAPWVFLDHASELRGVHNRVQNFTIAPISGPFLNRVSLE
mgnify:CR=1 FL=1